MRPVRRFCAALLGTVQKAGPRSRRAIAASGIAVALVASVAPIGDSHAAQAAGAAGATVTCTNGDSILGPLHSAITLAAGTSGSVVLGGLNGGKGRYVGNCTLNGTIPPGWTVTEASWVQMTATTGSANAGHFVVETGNSAFVDDGTFTNSGTFADNSQGLLQMIEVTNFVNTGTVLATSGGFGTAGPAFDPPCPKCTFVDRGTVVVGTKQSFSSGSTFVLAPSGTIADHGLFGLANESTFYVEGGAVTAGAPTSTQYLGLAAPTVKFAPDVPPTSHGRIDITNSANLVGVIAKHWELDVTGGSVAASHAGNAGTFYWDHTDNSSLTDATTFINSGTFSDSTTGWVQDIEVSRFVNTGTVTSDAPGFGMSGAPGISGPVFVNDGQFVIEPKANFQTAGTFDLASGTIVNHGNLGIDKSTLEVGGGSLLGTPANVNYYLGAGPATVTFEPSVPDSSIGSVDFGIGLTVNGVIPQGWVIDNVGGIGPALTVNHSGNRGTIIWATRAPFTAASPFTNEGTIKAFGTLEMSGANFVNAPTAKVLLGSGGGFSTSDNFHNAGTLALGPGDGVSVGGNFSQATGATLVASAAGNLSIGTVSATGTAYLGGALNVDKLPGLDLSSGGTANLVSAHAVSGRFRPVTGLGRPGPVLGLTYSSTTVTLGPPKAA